MPKRFLALLLLPLVLISFPNHLLAKATATSAGKLEPDPGGAYIQYAFGGGSIESLSKSSTDRRLIMEGTISPGELLTISCTGTQPGRDTAMTTIQSTHVMAYIQTSPRVDTKARNEAEQEKTIEKTGSAAVSASYTVPATATMVTAACYAKPSWFNMNGGHSATYLAQVNYKVIATSGESSRTKPVPRAPWPTRDQEPAKDPKRQDSGVRFSSISGEVSVKPRDEDDDSYEFAEMDMVLYNGDLIRTIEKSSAILSFPDLSTFELGEDSAIILDVGDDKHSVISLAMGKIWVNVKKMVLDGTLDVEMEQVALGNKGTVFICEEDGKTSRVKVLEGRVALTPHGKGTTLVSAGEEASVTNGKLSHGSSLDIEAEIRTWDPGAQARIVAALKERGIVVGEARAPSTQARIKESPPLPTANAWVLTERKPVRGDTPAPGEGGEVKVTFGEDAIEMLLAKPYGNAPGGSRDSNNPQRLHARYSWSMPASIQPGGQLVIRVRQQVLENRTGKWSNAFGVGIGIQNNWYLRGKTADGTAVEPWVFGIGWGRPDWAQKDASVTYERTWLWQEGKPGDKRMVSVAVQGIGTQKIEYVYEWK